MFGGGGEHRSRTGEMRSHPCRLDQGLHANRSRWLHGVTIAAVLSAATALGGCLFTNGVARGIRDAVVSRQKRDDYHFHPEFTVADPQFRRALDSVADPMIGGNSARLLENGDQIFPAMLG